MIEFYSSIAEYYDYIFPESRDQLDFVMGSGINPGCKILDMGCATGSLSVNLALNGFDVTAFDLDEKMVEIAILKQEQTGLDENPDFFEFDMRHLKLEFDREEFDTALCIGNTLPHLTDENDLLQFFEGLDFLLKPEGIFILQILNYDFILKQRLECLPLIENDHVRFERYYDFLSDGSLAFNTVLTVKGEEKVVNNSVRLNPLGLDRVKSILEKFGFKIVSINGNFNGESFHDKSLPLIITASK